jgi:tetratricopeptide (TPR) repeat protein
MKCPYCNYEFDMELTSCPSCGMMIQEYKEVLEELEKIKKPEESVEIAHPTPHKKKRGFSFILLFFTIIIIAFIIGAGAYQLGYIPQEVVKPLISKVKQLEMPFTKSKDIEQEPVEVAKDTTKDEPPEKEKTLFDEVTDEIESHIKEDQEKKDTTQPKQIQEKDIKSQLIEEQVEKKSESQPLQKEAEKEEKHEEAESLPFTAEEYAIMAMEDAIAGDIDKARENLQHALTQSPDMTSVKEYLALIDKALTHEEGKEALKHYFRALDFEKKKKNKKALQEYKKALNSYSDLPQALYRVGIYYSNKNDWDKALPLLEKAAPYFPDSKDLHYNLGRAYMENRNWKNAYEAFQKTVENDPDNFDALYKLALTAGLNNKWKEAIDAFEKVLPHRSNKGEIHYYIALAYYYTGEYEQAVKHSQQAIRYRYRVHPGLLKLLEPYRKS